METIIFGKAHRVSSVSFAALADKRLQRRDHHQSLFKETNRTVTQFCPFHLLSWVWFRENWNSSIS